MLLTIFQYVLLRAVCGIREKTLIINLPGSPKAAKECLSVVAPVIQHAVDLLRDNVKNIEDTHRSVQNDIVPKTTLSENKTTVRFYFGRCVHGLEEKSVV